MLGISDEDPDDMKLSRDRRRTTSMQEWLFVLALLTNFAGIIWFTARVKADLENSKVISAQIVSVLDKVVDRQAQNDIDIAVLKSQLKYDTQIAH